MFNNQNTINPPVRQFAPYRRWHGLDYKNVPVCTMPELPEEAVNLLSDHPDALALVLYKDGGVYGYIPPTVVLCAVLDKRECHQSMMYLLAADEWNCNRWVSEIDIPAVFWRAGGAS